MWLHVEDACCLICRRILRIECLLAPSPKLEYTAQHWIQDPAVKYSAFALLCPTLHMQTFSLSPEDPPVLLLGTGLAEQGVTGLSSWFVDLF
jgi:hypothetical protein